MDLKKPDTLGFIADQLASIGGGARGATRASSQDAGSGVDIEMDRGEGKSTDRSLCMLGTGGRDLLCSDRWTLPTHM